MNSSKVIAEEVAKALDVSSNHIFTYLFDGEITLILGQTSYSGGGGVTESLADELKKIV